MTAYGGQPPQTAPVAFLGYTYGGTNAAVIALTLADYADLKANFPFQSGINGDQFDRWVEQSYFLRHLFDSIADDPFS